MPSSLPCCPNCSSENVVKNGKIHNGKQNHKCNDCGRQFVEAPQNKIIDESTKRLIDPSATLRVNGERSRTVDKLLLEKLPLAGIARVTEVSELWLQHYVNTKYAEVPP